MLFAAMHWSLMAQSGHSDCRNECPLLGADIGFQLGRSAEPEI
jgi:hypothetical protein